VGFEELRLGEIDPRPTDIKEEWEGMPEFDQQDMTGLPVINMHFQTIEDRDEFAQKIGQKITDKTHFLWYPPVENDKLVDEGWDDES